MAAKKPALAKKVVKHEAAEIKEGKKAMAKDKKLLSEAKKAKK